MNIFATDNNPWTAAANLDDRRVIKMILESAQLLCTTIRERGYNDPKLYRSTHVNHPCRRWVGASPDNFDWLLDHALALCAVYKRAYGKTHKTYGVVLHIVKYYDEFYAGGNWINHTPFANCTPYKDVDNRIDAYRMYMEDKWRYDVLFTRNPIWRERTRPLWN